MRVGQGAPRVHSLSNELAASAVGRSRASVRMVQPTKDPRNMDGDPFGSALDKDFVSILSGEIP